MNKNPNSYSRSLLYSSVCLKLIARLASVSAIPTTTQRQNHNHKLLTITTEQKVIMKTIILHHSPIEYWLYALIVQ